MLKAKFLHLTLFTVKKTLNTIVSGGNHYIVQVRGNQKMLRKEVEKTPVTMSKVLIFTWKQLKGRTCRKPENICLRQYFGHFPGMEKQEQS
jgi:hypothetical protein